MSSATVSRSGRRALRIPWLSPMFAFPALWVLGVALAQLQLLRFEVNWSATTWLVMVAVPAAFVCGGVIGERIALAAAPLPELARKPQTSGRLRGLLVAMVAIGYLEICHQAIAGGTIPLLSSSIDSARTAQVGGASILLLELLSVAIVLALTVPQRPFARESRFELWIAAIALFGLSLQGGRGLIVLPIVVAFLARCFYWGRPRATLVIGVAAVLTIAIAGLFYAREAQHADQPFQAELYNEVIPETPAPLTPVLPYYFALATNFDALNAIVGHFPSAEPFGNGVYDSHALDRVLPYKAVGGVSEQITPPWVTSTAAGPLWADGGLPWVVIGMALIGMLCAGGYRYARATGAFRHALVASYLLFLALFGVYTNYWTNYTNWLFVIPALAMAGAVAESPTSPPGLLRRGRDLLGWARGRAEVLLRPAQPLLGPLRRLMPSRDQLAGAFRRLRSPVAIALGAIALLVVIGLAVKEDGPEGGLPISEPIQVQKGDQASDRVRLATDGDIPTDNAPLWVFAPDGARETTDVVNVRGADAGDRRRLPVSVPAVSDDETLDVARWNPDVDEEALFRMRDTADGVHVEVEGLQGDSGLFVEGGAVLPPVSPGATRQYSIATWSGNRPDLYVIDRGLDSERVRVQILSGESDFGEKLLDVRLPIAGLAPDRWVVDVGDATGVVGATGALEPDRPDLVMVNRDGSQGGQPELHLISGESGYSAFALQRVFPLSEQIESDSRFLFGAVDSGGQIYAVTPRRGQPDEIRLIEFRPKAPPV